MGRRHWNDGQEIVVEDLNSATYAMERQLYERLAYEMLQRTDNAFFGDSLQVLYSSPNTVVVKAGLGLQRDNAQASPQTKVRPMYRSSDSSHLIETPDASFDRIDIVCVRAAVADELSGSRKVKDAGSGVITNETLVVQKDWLAEILIVEGTPSASPVVPATPAGYIKIAELDVTAVTGLSGSGAITDNRSQMPVGSLATINTTGFQRLTVGSSVPLSTLFQDIDALLYRGRFNYFDVDEINSPAAEPGNPAASTRRIFYRDSVLYIKSSSGTKVPVGSGGGGGGGLIWTPVAGQAPVLDEENSVEVYLFESGLTQRLCVWLKVPESYLAGQQITMLIAQYSPSASGTQLLQANVSLVRKNQDSVASPASTRVSTNTAITNTVANQYRSVTLDITTALGAVGAFAVQPGDLLKVEISRSTDTDTADIRFIPSATEVKVG